MWLEAIITKEDFVQVLGELLPVKIYLDQEDEKEGAKEEAKEKEKEKDRWLLLGKATAVALVPEGLRVTCPAEFSWSIAGVNPTMKLDELRVLLRPEVVEKNKGAVLEFNIQVEEADFHSLPEFIDATIAKAVNTALAAKKPIWDFTDTLTHTVGLGKMFDPIEGLKIGVSWGKLRVNEEALTLVISFKIGFVRGD
jgi:hypothetical protein